MTPSFPFFFFFLPRDFASFFDLAFLVDVDVHDLSPAFPPPPNVVLPPFPPLVVYFSTVCAQLFLAYWFLVQRPSPALPQAC